MRLRHASFTVAALLAAGCSSSGKSAPSLTMPSAVDHTARYFPIDAQATHGPAVGQASADCNGCHYDKAATPPGPSATFKVFTCTGCHDQIRPGVIHSDQAAIRTLHGAVADFDSTVAASNTMPGVDPFDVACRSCHPSGVAVDHAKVFALPHQDLAATVVAKCADCHVNPADRTQLGCSACHPHDAAATTSGHALVPDFVPNGATPAAVQAASTLCARCHEDGKIPVAVSAHAAGAGGFVVGSGAHAGPAGGACLSCHPQNRTNAPRTFVADFSATTCVGCHVTVGGTAFHDDPTSLGTLHATVADFTSTVTSLGLSAACLSCHADGASAAPANHEQLFPRAAGTAHAGIACSDCHGSGARDDLTSLRCAACHNAIAGFSTKHAPIGGIAILNLWSARVQTGTVPLTSPNCLKCHADSQVDRIASHPGGDAAFGRSDHFVAGCISCHATTRPASEKPYPAVDFTFPTPPTRTGTASCYNSCHVAINNN